MKRNFLALTLLLSMFTISCTTQSNKEIQNLDKIQKKSLIEKIEITEQTRGFNKSTLITPTEKIVTLNGEKSSSKITTEQWNNLIKEIEKVDLNKINTFESLSNDRFRDAALATTIIITSEGKEYRSLGFDTNKPPQELNALYNHLKENFALLEKLSRSFVK